MCRALYLQTRQWHAYTILKLLVAVGMYNVLSLLFAVVARGGERKKTHIRDNARRITCLRRWERNKCTNKIMTRGVEISGENAFLIGYREDSARDFNTRARIRLYTFLCDNKFTTITSLRIRATIYSYNDSNNNRHREYEFSNEKTL